MKEKITPDIIAKVDKWLGKNGIKFFQMCREKHGTVMPCLILENMPHPVHFREGMQVRNFLRKCGLCDDWTFDDIENGWTLVIIAVLDEHLPPKKDLYELEDSTEDLMEAVELVQKQPTLHDHATACKTHKDKMLKITQRKIENSIKRRLGNERSDDENPATVNNNS